MACGCSEDAAIFELVVWKQGVIRSPTTGIAEGWGESKLMTPRVRQFMLEVWEAGSGLSVDDLFEIPERIIHKRVYCDEDENLVYDNDNEEDDPETDNPDALYMQVAVREKWRSRTVADLHHTSIQRLKDRIQTLRRDEEERKRGAKEAQQREAEAEAQRLAHAVANKEESSDQESDEKMLEERIKRLKRELELKKRGGKKVKQRETDAQRHAPAVADSKESDNDERSDEASFALSDTESQEPSDSSEDELPISEFIQRYKVRFAHHGPARTSEEACPPVWCCCRDSVPFQEARCSG